MMTQTKHKIFNNKIKMLLLILIWTLIWRDGNADKMAKVADVVDDGDGGDFDGYGVTMASTTMNDSNGDDDVDDDNDVVVVDDSAELKVEATKSTNNAIYGHNDSRALNAKMYDKQNNAVQTALNDQLTNNNDENDVDDDDDDDAMNNSSNALINNAEGNEKQFNAGIDVVGDDVVVSDVDVDDDDDDDELSVGTAKTTTATILPTSAEDVANAVLAAGNVLTEAEISVMLKQKLIYDFAIKYKQIPRITYFTCKASQVDNNNNNNNNNNYNNNDQRKINTIKILQGMYNIQGTATATSSSSAAESNEENNNNNNNNSKAKSSNNDYSSNFLNINNTQTDPKAILIKLVQIDQLINKRRSNNNNNRRSSGASSYSSYGHNINVAAAGLNAGGFGYGRGAGAAPGGRNSYSNANWLEDVLRSDRLRQIVVLDLGCGAASRKLIEMASNKELFSTAFHWLLIEEDYAVNRQTPINDNKNNNKNNKSNNNNMNSNNNEELANARYTQHVASVSWNDENNYNKNNYIDSNNNNNNNNVNNLKKRNIIAATNIHSKTVANRFIAKLLQYNSEYVVGNRSQQQQQQRQRFASNGVNAFSSSLSTNSAIDDDAKNMEIIEKFLQKINFNINSELILAKRIRTGGNAAIAVEAGAVPVAGLDNTGYTSNKILQKKDYYMLHDVWNPGLQYGGQLNISEIGSFTLDDGLQIDPWYQRSTTITRRMNMKNARIRCLIVITHKNRTDTLEEYLSTHYDTHLDSMNRFNFALLAHVRDLYNFSFILSKTSSWGYLKNGKFDGMIGALTRKQADIGGSPIFFRIERAKVIDYTSRTWVARPCFIFRHPRSTKKDRIVFLQPFSNDIWILTAMCGIITILLLWSLTNIERKIGPDAAAGDGKNLPLVLPKNYSVSTTTTTTTTTRGNRIERNHNAVQTITATALPTSLSLRAANNQRLAADGQTANNNNNNNNSNNQTLASSKQTAVVAGHGFKQLFVRCGNIFCGQDGDDASRRRVGLFLESVLFYIGSICQQGLAYSTSFFSGRCIVTTSLLFSFAIYQFYSASIVGTLLMEKPKTIRTLRDLIHSSLEIGIEDIVYNRDYFLRTKDPDAIELYAKKVTAVPMNAEQGFLELPPDEPAPTTPASAAAMAKSYREILHSHETGAHAKTNEASNWYDPEYGVSKIKKGRFAFHVDVATAYKIISDTFNEKEICDLTEIQLFPPQKMVSIVQKGSPLRKIITYGLRRVTEVGLMDYQRKVWHSPKPRCVKQIHTDDLRVDMQTFTSALLVLIFGYAVSLLALGLEIMHHKLWQRFVVEAFGAQDAEDAEKELQ